MKSTSRFILMSAVILMTLVMSAVWTVPAFADDGVTPPTDPISEEVTPTEPPEDSPPAEISAPVDISPVDEIAPAAETSLPELLDQLPEGTNVIVTDSAGEAVPLVSEEAAQAIITHDPMWCPLGATPGAATCSTNYGSLDLLVTQFSTTGMLTNGALVTFVPTGNGVIWIEAGTDGSAPSPIIINGLNPNFSTIVGSSLTLQGGWSGLNNITVTPATPSIFNQQISIINWTGAVTVKNITIDNVTINTAVNDYALTVTTAGNITLDGVTITDSMNNDGGNTLGGASLDNDPAVGIGLGTVIVNNSAFNNNEGDGLVINSDGIVTTNNLIANGNGKLSGGRGVYINNSTSADKAVIMKGFKQFNDNGGDGLKIDSRGLITLSNINANDNGANGVSIDNSGSVANLGVTISGTNYFMGNTVDGLNILSNGTLTLNSINALYNTGSGAILDNCQDNGLGGCYAPAKNVMLTGTNNFSWNTNFGLKVFSFGMITVNNVTANNNATESGVFLNNTRSTTGLAGVSVLGTNYFSSNGDNLSADSGITVLSHGAIIGNNITALYNDGVGAYFDNCGNTGIPTTACTSVTIAKSVSLTGTNVFNGNNVGLKIYSFGSISMSNVTANNNNNNTGGNGVIIHNDTTNSVATESIGTITLSGYGTFNFNSFDGLNTFSHSHTTLTNVTANSNGSYGVVLVASRTTGAANISFKGTNTFNNNGATGLNVDADGSISVSSLTANSNGLNGSGGNGAYLVNNTSTLPANVTLTGFVNVNNNPKEGLLIDTRGAVILTNVNANNNGECTIGCGNDFDGVYIKNTTLNTSTPQNVTLNGTNSFTNNVLNGLHVESYGIITINNITANHNTGGAGVYLDNYNPGISATVLPRGITILGYIRVNDNANEGLYINTRGVVSLTNIYANNNGLTCIPVFPAISCAFDGVSIKNNYANYLNTAAYSQNVTITGVNTFTNNGLNGLYVLSYGAISVSNITASKNVQNGASLDNCKVGSGCTFTSTNKNITISGRNLFYMNGFDGLVFNASGAAILSGVSANSNGLPANGGYTGTGVLGSSTGAMTLTCTHLYGNEGSGYILTTAGALTFNGLHSYNNLADTPTSPPAVIKINLLCP